MALNNKPTIMTPKPNCNANSITTPSTDTSSFHCRRKLRRRGSFAEQLLRGRRNLVRYLLLFPLLYISALITCVGPISALFRTPTLPGSVYKSHQIFDRLFNQIQDDNSSAIQVFITLFLCVYVCMYFIGLVRFFLGKLHFLLVVFCLIINGGCFSFL